jgi:hypothetical protein
LKLHDQCCGSGAGDIRSRRPQQCARFSARDRARWRAVSDRRDATSLVDLCRLSHMQQKSPIDVGAALQLFETME